MGTIGLTISERVLSKPTEELFLFKFCHIKNKIANKKIPSPSIAKVKVGVGIFYVGTTHHPSQRIDFSGISILCSGLMDTWYTCTKYPSPFGVRRNLACSAVTGQRCSFTSISAFLFFFIFKTHIKVCNKKIKIARIKIELSTVFVLQYGAKWFTIYIKWEKVGNKILCLSANIYTQ